MEQFSLEKYLENPNRKVVTRDGRPVRIICTDRKTSNSTNVIGLAKNPYDVEQLLVCNTDGRDVYKEIQNDLFFADEEKELTEFEKAIYQHICTMVTACDGKVDCDEILKPVVKGIAKDLLDLARKEIRKEEQEKLGTLEMPIDPLNPHYQKGRENALKYLPKWKKLINGAQGSLNDIYLVRASYGHYFVCSAITAGCEYLDLTELENLPKEE